MRGKQLIQLLQFIFVWVLIWLFVVFVLEISFVDFLLKYRLYFLVVSISYFYYYSIQYDFTKKSNLIRYIIIYGNLYLFAHLFFRPLLNISHELFILFWLIVLWIYWTTKLKTKWKYLFWILWWLLSFFIFISWMLYLYPDRPDVAWFIDSRHAKVFVWWISESIPRREAYLQIEDLRKVNDFDIVPSFEMDILESSKISYPSLKKDRDENILIISPYWDAFLIFPQSEVQLEFDGDKLITVSKLNWRIWVLSWLFDSPIWFVWESDLLSLNQQEQVELVQYQYKYDFVSYLKDQISDSSIALANNTIMYNIDWKIIKILARMFPAKFTRNLYNYEEFQKYFSWISDDNKNWLNKYSLKYWSWWSSISYWNTIKNNIEIWKNNTYWIFGNH